MHKLIIKYNKQLKMLNLRDGKTYTISEDERRYYVEIVRRSHSFRKNNQGT